MKQKEKIEKLLWELKELLLSYEVELGCHVKVDGWGVDFEYLDLSETNPKGIPETYRITTEFQDMTPSRISQCLRLKK
jgi:hypothetical protein